MPTIHDLVRAIAQREGVDAAVVLGRDGLVIDARTAATLDAEQVAALAPAIAASADALGTSTDRGALATAVLEFENGLAVVSPLNTDVLLVVLLHPSANVGPLLYDLRRHRALIASIV
ncbi:MAG TPA: roadblock/LC7 domain-containing protein [Gemmatimonadaceae bacterium]